MLVPLQPPLNNTVEIKIRLINNSVVEDREHFSISIHSNHLQITVPTVSQIADFYILDDDSKSGAINNLKIIFTSISIGLTVGFSSPIYDGREDDNSVAEVCITLSGETERNFMVTLNVNNGTATGQSLNKVSFIFICLLSHLTEGVDYNYTTELPADFHKNRLCHQISLLSDTILEGNETIVFQLSSNESFVDLIPSSAVFTIIDSVRYNDSFITLNSLNVL